MKQRTITGIILLLILGPLIAVDFLTIPFQVVMGCFAVIAVLELLKMYETEKKYNNVIKCIIVFCALLIYGSVITIIYTNFDFSLLFAAVIFVIIILSITSVFSDFDGRDVVKGLFSILYSSFGISALVLLKSINVDFIIYLFLITCSTDVFAYFGGVLFGKHKMAPVISPKKTWEGAITGSVVGTVVASCFAIFLGINNSNIFSEIVSLNSNLLIVVIILITLLSTILGQIGDLVASKLKRTYDIKDYGKIFPGHGGVLDRFDSVIFVGMFLLAIILIL